MLYNQIPKRHIENLKWRRGIIRACNDNEEIKKEVWIACKRDMLFYINTFVWTFDPRPDMEGNALGIVPFNTYKFQDDALIEMQEYFGRYDMFIDKSRDMGASWLNILLFEWFWHFHPNKLDLLMVSRNEAYVDEKGNEKALFSKIDLIHKYLPSWLMPSYDRSKLMLVNFDTGSKITGESTTGDVARGGRFSAILLDEFSAVETKDGYRALSSTKDASRCRIFNSTYKGVNNAFYEVKGLKNIKKLTFFWTQHPEKAKGLYIVKEGQINIIDEEWHAKNPDYEFNLTDPQNDAGYRSPWYDWEEGRSVNKIEMAQEVDMNAAGGGYQYYPTALIEKTISEHCRPPYRVCDFNYDQTSASPDEDVAFRDNENGKFKLWCIFKDGKPDADGQYFIGCDVAVGTGATPSVLSVGNSTTGEKILEYANNTMLPHDFGKLAVAIAKFFVGRDGAGAKLNWEANGPGREFGISVQDTGYGNLYYRENIETQKETNFAGWWSDPKTKQALFSTHREAMFKSTFINRSIKAVKECAGYVQGANTVEHEKAKHATDASDNTDNHGDYCVADAVLNWTMKTQGRYTEEPEEETAPEGSFQWRLDKWENGKQQQDDYLY